MLKVETATKIEKRRLNSVFRISLFCNKFWNSEYSEIIYRINR